MECDELKKPVSQFVQVIVLSSRLLSKNLKNKIYRTIILPVVLLRRLRWAEHLARMEAGRSAFKNLTGTPTGNRSLGRYGVDGRTMLEWILKK